MSQKQCLRPDGNDSDNDDDEIQYFHIPFYSFRY